MGERRYWIGVVSQDHVEAAVAHGFVQLNHGKPHRSSECSPATVSRSIRRATTYPAGAPLQAFTAIGRVAKAPIYEANDAGARHRLPARRRISRRDARADQAAARAPDVHPQQDALGRGVSLRPRARAARGLRDNRTAMGRDPDVDFA